MKQQKASSPFGAIDVGVNSVPAFVDRDMDGDADLVVGSGEGGLKYYENVGGTLAARPGASNPYRAVHVTESVIALTVTF